MPESFHFGMDWVIFRALPLIKRYLRFAEVALPGGLVLFFAADLIIIKKFKRKL